MAAFLSILGFAPATAVDFGVSLPPIMIIISQRFRCEQFQRTRGKITIILLQSLVFFGYAQNDERLELNAGFAEDSAVSLSFFQSRQKGGT